MLSEAFFHSFAKDFGLCEIPTGFTNKYRRVSEMAYEVTVDPDKCEGCEECVEVCPVDVYEIQDGKSVPVNAEECLGCESCVEVCDQEAITVTEV